SHDGRTRVHFAQDQLIDRHGETIADLFGARLHPTALVVYYFEAAIPVHVYPVHASGKLESAHIARVGLFGRDCNHIPRAPLLVRLVVGFDDRAARLTMLLLLLRGFVTSRNPAPLNLLSHLLRGVRAAQLVELLQHVVEGAPETVTRPRPEVEAPDLVEVDIAILDGAFEVGLNSRRAERRFS